MKRRATPVIDPLEELAVDIAQLRDPVQLHALLQRVQALYSEAVAPVTALFFRDGCDVFFGEIVPRLALTERVGFMWSLRRVCKLWAACVPRATTHLNFCTMAEWSPTVYASLLVAQFPVATSVRSHRGILGSFFDGATRFASVTRLEIPGDAEDSKNPLRYSLDKWVALATLIFPSCDRVLGGLARCTTLTHLDINGDALSTGDELRPLVHLRHLRIRFCDKPLPIQQMRALRYLESDNATYFAAYTGHGLLKDEQCADDDERLVLDRDYWPGCQNYDFQGAWNDGRFTGDAFFQYDALARIFFGYYVDGRKHGAGEEECEAECTLERGHWFQGRRHGHFDVYSWPEDEDRAQDESNMRLVRIEQWCHGVRQEDAFLLDIPRTP